MTEQHQNFASHLDLKQPQLNYNMYIWYRFITPANNYLYFARNECDSGQTPHSTYCYAELCMTWTADNCPYKVLNSHMVHVG